MIRRSGDFFNRNHSLIRYFSRLAEDGSPKLSGSTGAVAKPFVAIRVQIAIVHFIFCGGTVTTYIAIFPFCRAVVRRFLKLRFLNCIPTPLSAKTTSHN